MRVVRINHSTLVLSFVLLAVALSSASAAKFYRWQDAEGNWHYTDTLPPEQVKREHTRIDNRGVQVEQVKRAKTDEERAQEAEIERLRKKQQLLIEKQQAEDRVLLRTFRSGDDIIMARDGKLRAVDLQIQLVKSNIKRLKTKLAEMQKTAADLELGGNPASPQYFKEIDKVRATLEDAYASIITKKERKNSIRQRYQKDLERFNELHKLSTLQSAKSSVEQRMITELKNVLDCGSDAECDQTWQKAEPFVQQHATTILQMLADSIIMTAPPKTDSDISITLSRIKDLKKGTTQLFMDLQCRDSEAGKKLCGSDTVAQIYRQFRSQFSGNKP